MTRSERVGRILGYFKEAMPVVTSELQFGSAFQLLVATMLSAQCTDARINQITPALFLRYPDARAMAQAEEEDLFDLIRSVSYPNAKARHLKLMAQKLVDDFGGEVPDDRRKLESLAGVGRKTANVVQAVWFGKPTLAVDTHVFRVSHRLGLVPKTADTPLKVELSLHRQIPDDIVPDAHHWLLLHGRYVCQSRKPKCGECPFSGFCPSSEKKVPVV